MYEFIHYQAQDVMTTEPVTVNQHISLEEVEKLFDRHDFNGLPVIDQDQRLIGIITKLDFLKAFSFRSANKVPRYKDIMAMDISEVMSKKVNVVYPDTPLSSIIQKIIETGYKSFPVVNEGRLVGIIAREDIVKALHQASRGIVPDRLQPPQE